MKRKRAPPRKFPEHPRKVWRRLQVETKKHEPIGRKKTADMEQIMRHGLRFIRTFSPKKIANGKFVIHLIPATHESPLAAGVFTQEGVLLGSIKLGFMPKTIVIEFIKGNAHRHANAEFLQTTGKPWANVLLQTIEHHARKQGYEHALFRRVETTEAYQQPVTGFEESAKHDAKLEQTRREMSQLWGINARKQKYKKIDEEFKGKKL